MVPYWTLLCLIVFFISFYNFLSLYNITITFISRPVAIDHTEITFSICFSGNAGFSATRGVAENQKCNVM